MIRLAGGSGGSGGAANPVPSLLSSFTAQAHGTAALTISPGSGVAPGALAVAVLCAGGIVSSSYPNGWLPVAPLPHVAAINGASQMLAMFYKILDANDIGGTTDWGNGANPTGVLCGVFGQAKGNGGWCKKFAPAPSANQAGATIVTPAFYPIDADVLVIAAVGTAGSGGNAAITPPSDYTLVTSLNGLGASFPIWMGYQLSVAGTQIGPDSATANGSGTFTGGSIGIGFGIG